eukprot:3938250-Rhodomonas_salina.1
MECKKETKKFERATHFGQLTNEQIDPLQPVYYLEEGKQPSTEMVETVTVEQFQVDSNHQVSYDKEAIEQHLRRTTDILKERCEDFKRSANNTLNSNGVSCTRYTIEGKGSGNLAAVYVCKGHSRELSPTINDVGVTMPPSDTTLTFLDITRYGIKAYIVTMEMHDAHTTVAVLTEHNFPKEMNIQSLLDVSIVLHDGDK